MTLDFPLEFQWENKEAHKLSIAAGSRLLIKSKTYKVAMHSRIHDSVIARYGVGVYRGISAYYDNSLGQGYNESGYPAGEHYGI